MNLRLSALIYIFLVSCQTVPTPIEVHLPAATTMMFSDCGGKDGALNMQIYRDEVLRGSGEMEWVSSREHGWKAQLVSPIGQALLRGEYALEQNHVDVSGPLASDLPKVSVDGDGFLEIDGHFIPLRPLELSCLWAFGIPRSWMQNVVEKRDEVGGMILDIAEPKRRIELTLPPPADAKKTCFTLKWRYFLGMIPAKLNICYDLAKPQRGEMAGIDDYVLKWVNVDDQ